jgi:hypothetical protein
MAASYLEQEGAFYAEKQPTDYIDWSKIGKDLSLTLNAEAKRREELKAKLDEEARQAINTLQQAPQGEHKGASQWALEFGDNGSQYMLNLNRLLKSGDMSVKDYTIAVQNLREGTNDTFNLMKEYQETFSEKMDRYKKGESQDLELWLNSQAEGYANFNKSQVYIDPSTGRVNIAMKEKKIIDGKEVYVMTSNPNQISTVNSLRNQLKGKYDKFDSDGATNSYVDALGKEITALRTAGGPSRSGQIMSIEDITSREYYEGADPKTRTMIYNFKEAETNAINAMLENPLNRSSILTNNIKFSKDGNQYSYTYDIEEAKKNKNLILLRLDEKSGQPIPDFENSPHGKEQMELSTEWLRTQARSKYDRKSDIETYNESRPEPIQKWQYDAGQEKKDEANTAMMLGRLWGAKNDAELKTATDYFSGFDPSIKKVTRGKNGLTITRLDATGNLETRNISFYQDGKLKSQEDFIRSAGPQFNLRDVNTALKKGGFIKGATFNTKEEDIVSQVEIQNQPKRSDYSDQINKFVEESVNIVEDDPAATIKLLKSKLGNKFTIGGGSRGFGTDYITIGKETFNIDNEGDVGRMKQYIKDNMDKSTNPYESGGGGKAPGDNIFGK